MSRIKTSTELAAARDCDLIIEAIIENEAIKNTFYQVQHTDTLKRSGKRSFSMVLIRNDELTHSEKD